MNRINRDPRMFQFTVAIVGGGFTGTTLAAQLLRRSGGSISVVLIERSARLRRGIAYSTEMRGALVECTSAEHDGLSGRSRALYRVGAP
jgi:glycine/D-amino acid oxidase-like deaminating enzyme